MENYLGKDIPKLGFGLMRLPMDGDVIDIEKTKEMADRLLKKNRKLLKKQEISSTPCRKFRVLPVHTV